MNNGRRPLTPTFSESVAYRYSTRTISLSTSKRVCYPRKSRLIFRCEFRSRRSLAAFPENLVQRVAQEFCLVESYRPLLAYRLP